MIENCTFAIIGPGVMGRTIAYSLINAGVAPQRLTLAGPNADRLAELAQELSVGTTLDNAAAVQSADVIILAVKPQRLNQAARVIRPALKETALVISIVAGHSTAALSQQLSTDRIVRAMPNTPARIGMGITVWTCTPQVDETQKETTAEVFRSMGEEVFVEDEVYLDMATALSGTGPAYVFLFMESMIDAGVHMGIPRRIAEQLVLQTLRGSTEFYAHRHEHPAALRNEVTSPGGTSAEALYYLEKAGFRTAISRAIWAAYQRSMDLGTGKSKQNLEG